MTLDVLRQANSLQDKITALEKHVKDAQLIIDWGATHATHLCICSSQHSLDLLSDIFSTEEFTELYFDKINSQLASYRRQLANL